MDYVDLYIIHRFDPHTPIEETVEALSDVVKAGKALYLGASSMWAWQFMKMLGVQRANGLAPFVSMQNYVHLVYREEEREMLPLCRAEGIAVTPWSPLARGFLAGSKPREGAATVRARTDTYQDTLGLGPGRTTPSWSGCGAWRTGSAPSRRRWRWPGFWPAGRHRPDHRRLQAASPGRRAGSAGSDARRGDPGLLEEPYRPRPVSGHT